MADFVLVYGSAANWEAPASTPRNINVIYHGRWEVADTKLLHEWIAAKEFPRKLPVLLGRSKAPVVRLFHPFGCGVEPEVLHGNPAIRQEPVATISSVLRQYNLLTQPNKLVDALCSLSPEDATLHMSYIEGRMPFRNLMDLQYTVRRISGFTKKTAARLPLGKLLYRLASDIPARSILGEQVSLNFGEKRVQIGKSWIAEQWALQELFD